MITATNPTQPTLESAGLEREVDSLKPGKQIAPRIAALELLPDFQRLALALSPRDPSTRDDLVQEMCLAVLLCKQPHTRSYYISVAVWRAKDYLRWWIAGLERHEPLEA